MFKYLFCVVMLSLLCQAKVFRFDYEFVEPANGWMKFHIVPSTWEEARMRCHAEGAVLASPLTNQLKNELIRFVLNKKGPVPTTIFTGVHASFSKGDYSSIEGVPLSRLPISWAPGEPDNYQNKESCLAMSAEGNGSTYDVRCDDVLPYVCFKKFTQLTMSACGTTDPGYVLDKRTGSCYKFHKELLTWSEGFQTCYSEGGYLAIIDDETERDVYKDIIKNNQKDVSLVVNVGFHDWGSYGHSFSTIHGDPIEEKYHTWKSGEPNNGTSIKGQYCGAMYQDGSLDDNTCADKVTFLCEKNPNNRSALLDIDIRLFE